ncbi:MAG: hypothetical protein ACIALR_11765 [Blastopirellula sp. JB062]
MYYRILVAVWAIPVMIAFAGCSTGEDKWTAMRPPVYKTHGVVREDGQPLSDAIVIFSAQDGDYSGTASTNESGEYQMTTFEDYDGVIEGEFLVSIEKNDWIPYGPEPSESVDGLRSSRPLKKVRLTAKKYADFEKSGFSVVVSPEGPNTFDFDLESDPKIASRGG